MDFNWFQLGPIPSNVMLGTYDYNLVALSYVMAVFASYVALDLAGRLRATTNGRSKLYWLMAGAFAMGAGIWSMHFIGMLAFIMKMPMIYDQFWTISSMIAAILASGLAMYLLRTEGRPIIFMAFGGFFLGIGIVTMHYMGMTAMEGVKITYLPSLFALSILIAVAASWAALWLALQSNQGTLSGQFRLKLASAFVMGAAICGMHYTGMAAAVFLPAAGHHPITGFLIDPNTLALYVAGVCALILGLALVVSTYQQLVDNAIQKEKELHLGQQLVMARQAGMAEVADCVLHNVGNVLNSVNISADLVNDKVSNSELDGLKVVKEIIQTHKENLGNFITTDPKGKNLPDYLISLADYWEEEHAVIKNELKVLTKNIQHIKDIITTQQALSLVVGTEEQVEVDSVIEDALQIISTNFERYHININFDYAPLNKVYLDKSKLMQIIINLIRNAKDALSSSDKNDKQLTLRIGQNKKDTFFIQVIDNGIGISAENSRKIFQHGFTTKKTGHGFGLHTSSIVAQEMGGKLTVESSGVNKGATFTLELPYKISMKQLAYDSRPTSIQP